MKELHFPWLEACILIPLVGAISISRLRDPRMARKWCLVFSGFTFLFALAAWQDFQILGVFEANDRRHLLAELIDQPIFVIDELSAPLLLLTALVFFLTIVATLRTKVRRFSFALALLSESIVLGTFCTKNTWLIVGLLIAGTVPPYLELRARAQSTRLYVLHMALFSVLLACGWFLIDQEGLVPVPHSKLAIVLLLGAVFIRSGIVPFHCWLPDLFERATFGTALLAATPIVGAYAAVRLVLPTAPTDVLRGMGVMSLFTAVYAAGMALVQRDARRFFCYLFLSHAALVLVGLEAVTPIGLTGALCAWLSVSLSLSGFGLTLRALESRHGRLSLREYQGLYEHMPHLAVCFALTGLASVGFPGTFGFIGTEILVDGAVEAYPYVGIAVVFAAALNGIAVVQAYFRLFTGAKYTSGVSLKIRTRESVAVLTLAAIILIGGSFPQPGVQSRYHAAHEILRERAAQTGEPPEGEPETSEDEDHAQQGLFPSLRVVGD